MEFQVKAEDKDGNIIFEGTLKRKEVEFVLNVGVNYLLQVGASPFMEDEEEDAPPETMMGPGSDTTQ